MIFPPRGARLAVSTAAKMASRVVPIHRLTGLTERNTITSKSRVVRRMLFYRKRTLDNQFGSAILKATSRDRTTFPDLAGSAEAAGTLTFSDSIPISLSNHDIHIWNISTHASDLALSAFEQVLTVEERNRANRQIHPQRRASFVMVRGALRCILARYLGISPLAICFVYGLYGKPALHPSTSFSFNLSYAEELAVIAVATHCSVGVDVERIHDLPDLERLAERFFSLPESARISSLPLSARRSVFFRCWTRKEAYLKADGRGFSVPPNSFEIDSICGLTDSPQNSPAATVRPDRWTVQDLPSTPDYCGALVYSGGPKSWSLFSVCQLRSPWEITYCRARQIARQHPLPAPAYSGLNNDAPTCLPHVPYPGLLSQ